MNKSILFYDSGIGGLSTLKCASKVLQNESFVYFADDKNIPYGNKSPTLIKKLVINNIDNILKKHKIKLIVLACNTATSACKPELEKRYKIPVVGIEPAIKKASEESKTKQVLCIATKATIMGEKYRRLLKQQSSKIYSCFMPNFASKIESGLIYGNLNITNEINFIKSVLDKHKQIDQIVLGCTHYSLAIDKLKQEIKVNFTDGNLGVSKEICRILKAKKQIKTSGFMNLKIILSSKDTKKQKIYYDIFEKIP